MTESLPNLLVSINKCTHKLREIEIIIFVSVILVVHAIKTFSFSTQNYVIFCKHFKLDKPLRYIYIYMILVFNLYSVSYCIY